MIQSSAEPVYTTEQVAEWLRVSPFTARRWLRDGTLPATKCGGHQSDRGSWCSGHWVVSHSVLLSHIADHTSRVDDRTPR